ncbi:hypothetical protein [Streptomyces glomeratus]|uniref:Uncharacterized protein n=1 Tax=Streptomyces glomeratus TaxID=284452 RepID=A0ABP6LGY1_9ACTN|nr:hypothetical protein [Streptomyces glomeratus]MCF1509192.1 hypothetical protein [Streptomyces glomeratus]
MTADPHSVSESFTYVCGDCGRTWDTVFRVVVFADRDGLTSQAYIDERGRVLKSPSAAAVCPGCGGSRVHALPPGLAARAHAAERAVHERYGPRVHTPRPLRHFSSPRGRPGGRGSPPSA